MARGTWGGTGDRHPFRVRISWTQLTSVCQTGFYVRSQGAEIGSPTEVATAVMEWVDQSFRTLLAPTNRILGVDVVDVVSREGHAISPSNMFGTIVGYSDAAALPSFIACVVSLRSALRTRYGQGRMFWPVAMEGTAHGDVIGNAVLPQYQGVMDNLAGRFIQGSVVGYQLINIHGVIPPRAATPTRPATASIPASWHDVISMRLNANLTALRSRKAGVGS